MDRQENGSMMKQRIYKYKFKLDERTESSALIALSLPHLAQIMTIQLQRGEWMLWALVNPDAPLVRTHIRCFVTGIDLPNENWGDYITTVQDGLKVWHFFLGYGQ